MGDMADMINDDRPEEEDILIVHAIQCTNGCNAPVYYPSKVLCQACFNRLGKKLKGLADPKNWEPGENNG